VTAGIDLNSGLATWTFTSLDPSTLDVPSDILSGFLPPDQNPPQGEAFVNYSIQPKATDTTGTRINAKATVVFDAGLPDQSSLDTAPIFNTIDAAPPTSTATPLPPFTTTPTFTVSWSGTDDAGGSGIAGYDIYVSDNGGPFAPFLLGTTRTSAAFTGQTGHSYGFYSVATDNVGNRQATPAAAQAITVINTTPPVINPIAPQAVADGSTLAFTLTATSPSINGSPVPLTFSLGSGAPAGAAIHAQTGRFTWTPSQSNGIAPGVYHLSVAAAEVGAPTLAATAALDITVGPSSTNQGHGMAARAAVASALTHSAEYYADFATSAYRKYLGRTPRADEVAYWVNRMQHGLSDERLEAGFIGSAKYIANHGGAGPKWVQGLYVDLLGRTPRSDEVAYWVNNLNRGESPADVAYGFAASKERETQRVSADYNRNLGRSATQAELPYWVNVFLAGTDNEQVIAGFVGSQEYFQHHSGNIVDWLFAAYCDVLQRQPDTVGYQYWVDRL
jgi:hypothetical protein